MKTVRDIEEDLIEAEKQIQVICTHYNVDIIADNGAILLIKHTHKEENGILAWVTREVCFVPF